MATFPSSVRVIVNGLPVDASTTNGPISDLTARTDWLKAQLDALDSGTQMILRSQPVEAGLSVGQPVYLDSTDDTFKAALADIDQSNLNRAADRAFWQGLILSVSGTSADIVIGGTMTLTTAEWAAVFDDGTFAPGDVFLGGTTAGTISSDPGTTGIYLGHLRATGEMLVRLGNPGAFIDHVHIQRSLLGQPATTSPTDPAVNGTHVVSSPDTNERGWLPANSTYFPGFVSGVQIPTGAAFGYNIQHPDEEDLRAVFPVLPQSNAQFEQGGLILGQDLVVVNQYGIWWMDNSYGNAPWPVDYAANYPPSTASDILLWTTRIIASATVLDLVREELLQEYQNGAADEFAVTGLLSTDPDSLEVAGTDGDATNGWRGQVNLTPLGVNAARYARGLDISGSSGNNVDGFRGLTDFEFVADLEAKHQYTNVTGDQMALVSTNGFAAGSTINLRGHRLGPDAGDYIDFLVTGGRDLLADTEYQVTVLVHAAVDTASATPADADVTVEFYRLVPGSPLSSTQLLRSEEVTFQTGLPGELQAVTIGPFADTVVEQNEHLLVRFTASSGGSPLPADTLRIVSVYYGLTEA